MASSTIGKPITIADYDPVWRQRFAYEQCRILDACGRDAFAAFEHVGSTAVVGLAAKPIIDMMPGLRSLDDAPPIIEKLQAIGYAYVREFEKPTEFDDGMPFRRYLRKDVNGTRAFHMHIVESASDFWDKHLLFRDYLRAHDDERDAYAQLKRELAADFNANLKPNSNVNAGYTDRKTEFVERCVAAARTWRQQQTQG